MARFSTGSTYWPHKSSIKNVQFLEYRQSNVWACYTMPNHNFYDTFLIFLVFRSQFSTSYFTYKKVLGISISSFCKQLFTLTLSSFSPSPQPSIHPPSYNSPLSHYPFHQTISPRDEPSRCPPHFEDQYDRDTQDLSTSYLFLN